MMYHREFDLDPDVQYPLSTPLCPKNHTSYMAQRANIPTFSALNSIKIQNKKYNISVKN